MRSGAVLGKLLVSDALKNQLSPGLKDKLLEQYGLTQAIIIDRVYKQPFPSRFLASLSPFILENIDDPTTRHIVDKSFSDFFERNVMQYNYQENKVNFVGSIAFYYIDYLKRDSREKCNLYWNHLCFPMEGLVAYYASR